MLNVDQKLRAGNRSTPVLESRVTQGAMSKRSSMLRNAIVAFAIVLVLGSSAFARDGGYSGGGGGDGFRGNHFGGGFGGTPGNGHGGYGNGASGLRGGFRGYRS